MFRISSKIVDIGCGSGEICIRLAHLFPQAEVWGIDLEARNIENCILRMNGDSVSKMKDQVHFQVGNAYELKEFADNTFDLVVCRSVLHAIKDPLLVMQQMVRISKKGGVLHMLNEDYGMLYCFPTEKDVEKLWDACRSFFKNTGTNPLIGRMSYNLSFQLGSNIKHIDIEHIFADTVKAPREIIAKIFETWRDGYSDIIASNSSLSKEEIYSLWNEVIDCCRKESCYVCWQIVVCSLQL